MLKKLPFTLFAVMLIFQAAVCEAITINQTNETEPNDTLGTANILGSAGTYTCGFSQNMDVDFYSFTTTVSGAVLTVEAVGATLPSVDTYMNIYNYSGNLISSNDDGNGLNAKISNLTLGAPGKYYIEIYEATNYYGAGINYRLTGTITEKFSTGLFLY